ncbi:hypothetical protein MW887_001604 [Aspergillus wentii]|nr:hypothetical protein MW887_001604 [Aspergillus wentii]
MSSPQDRVMEDATTPTTPRPNSHTLSAQESTDDTDSRLGNSNNGDCARSQGSAPPMPDDSAPGDSDGERDGSDHETDPGSTAPPSKKKKGQRFYCTDFPPCNLSFTRSEHLARHIRKHTGERPFQCHCSRRFSRLDNLRQHAQTVHVNEEIPGDSLAATGTRFQRQIRTDRVRPPGRARAGTAGSQGAHSRGHSRNLSASSITSTASTFSQPPEIRRRPPPLIMANDGSARARLALDTMADPPRTPPGRGIGPSAGSPYTPSNMFGGGSPHVGSPMSTASHASGFWDGKTAARRLSVPTGTNPFIPQHAHAYPPGYVGPAATTAYPSAGGVFASPVSSNYSVSRDEASQGAEADLRRRTWHPTTYYPRPATSGLNNYQTPDGYQSSLGSSGSAEQPPRLPGIESFDKVVSQQRPLTPPVRKPSPMQVDTHSRPPPGYAFGGGFNYNAPAARPPPPVSGPGHRRGHVSWDMSLHTNLTGLNIRDKPQRDASHWGQQTIAEIQNVASRPSSSYQATVPHPHEKVHRWSHATRTSPEDSSSSEGVNTPSTASLEYHPAIVHNNGYIEPHHPPLTSDSSQTVCAPVPSPSENYHVKHEPRSEFYSNSSREPGMGRLEALVAVATSENKSAKVFV